MTTGYAKTAGPVRVRPFMFAHSDARLHGNPEHRFEERLRGMLTYPADEGRSAPAASTAWRKLKPGLASRHRVVSV